MVLHLTLHEWFSIYIYFSGENVQKYDTIDGLGYGIVLKKCSQCEDRLPLLEGVFNNLTTTNLNSEKGGRADDFEILDCHFSIIVEVESFGSSGILVGTLTTLARLLQLLGLTLYRTEMPCDSADAAGLAGNSLEESEISHFETRDNNSNNKENTESELTPNHVLPANSVRVVTGSQHGTTGTASTPVSLLRSSALLNNDRTGVSSPLAAVTGGNSRLPSPLRQVQNQFSSSSQREDETPSIRRRILAIQSMMIRPRPLFPRMGTNRTSIITTANATFVIHDYWILTRLMSFPGVFWVLAMGLCRMKLSSNRMKSTHPMPFL